MIHPSPGAPTTLPADAGAKADQPAQAIVVRDPVPIEIDAAHVVSVFKREYYCLPAESALDEFGFDRGVSDVDASLRATTVMIDCPVCAGRHAHLLYAVDGMRYQVVTCAGCGLGLLFPLPRCEEIARFYPPDYYGTAGAKFEPLVEAFVRLVGARHARALSRRLPEGARILDVGCGRGVLLGALADKGFDVYGFEVSALAAEGADPRAQISIAADLADAGYPDAYFDQVIVWHVLEHLPDPRGTLLEIRRILRPGGRLVVSVPNFSSYQARWAGAAWFHLDLPRHLYHFPLPALRRLLESCGFACRSEHHFSFRQNPFGWLQSLLNKNRSLPRNGLYRMLKRRNDATNKLFKPSTRFWFRLAYFLGMPVAITVSVLAALLRNGATVYLVTEAVGPAAPSDQRGISG